MWFPLCDISLLLAQANTKSPTMTLILFAVWFLVGCFLMAFAVWVMRVRKSAVAEQRQYLEQARQHMETVEAKSDRMIELLESIDRKLEGRRD